MKKIKNIFTVISMVAISFTFYSAGVQPPTTLDLLCAPKMWLEARPVEVYTSTQFTTTHMTNSLTHAGKNETISGTNLYYLSDTEVSVFDYNKVGKVETGKYIIIEQLPEDPPKILEIKSLSAEELILFYDSKGKNIPGQTTSTWWAIMK